MDDNSTKRYFNALCKQPHLSKYNIYNSASVPIPEDDCRKESEDYNNERESESESTF